MPKTFNSQLVDDWVRVGDAESFHVARELARREGMLLGGSSGTTRRRGPAVRPPADGRTTWSWRSCADTGRNYLSKFFDDAWLAANKLTMGAGAAAHRSATCSRSRASGRW